MKTELWVHKNRSYYCSKGVTQRGIFNEHTKTQVLDTHQKPDSAWLSLVSSDVGWDASGIEIDLCIGLILL